MLVCLVLHATHADTGHVCKLPGYEDFTPDSLPEGCAQSNSDWINLDPPACGEGEAYPEGAGTRVNTTSLSYRDLRAPERSILVATSHKNVDSSLEIKHCTLCTSSEAASWKHGTLLHKQEYVSEG